MKTQSTHLMKLHRIQGYQPPVTVAREDDDLPETTIIESVKADSNYLLLIMSHPAYRGMKEADLQRITQLRAQRARFLALRLELIKAIATGVKKLPDPLQAEYDSLTITLQAAQLNYPIHWQQSAPPSTGASLGSERQLHDYMRDEATVG